MIRFLTAGESHGREITGIIDGLPAGLEIDLSYMQYHLSRRQHGYGRSERMSVPDEVEIVSGLYNGKTTGAPVTCVIPNRLSSADFSKEVFIPRPGHADETGLKKYKYDNFRPVIERASARETAIRVALGSFARKFLEEFQIVIASHVIQIGTVKISPEVFFSPKKAEDILRLSETSVLHVADSAAEQEMIRLIDQAKQDGDSLGGVVEILADGLPAGLGSYRQWDARLGGLIMQTVGSVPGAKGVEIGDGFGLASVTGSRAADEFVIRNGKPERLSNHNGGLEGGMTTGQPLVVRAAMKPIPTIRKALSSYDIRTNTPADAHYERADVCAVTSFGVVAESMLALALVNPFLEKYGGDSVGEIKQRFLSKS